MRLGNLHKEGQLHNPGDDCTIFANIYGILKIANCMGVYLDCDEIGEMASVCKPLSAFPAFADDCTGWPYPYGSWVRVLMG